MSKLVRILLIVLIIAGCSKHEDNHPAESISINKAGEDFLMPSELIRILENDLTAETKILSPVFHFVPLKIALEEKTSKTLKSPQMQFQYPKGGGVLDLNDVVVGQGSFFLSFPAEQFTELPELVHLFYVSQAPKKKFDGEEFGLGCGKWVDIKDKFTSLNKPQFLSLNTTDLRHLYVLAGHYIFAFRKSNQIYLTQLTITDSKNQETMCPRIKGPGL